MDMNQIMKQAQQFQQKMGQTQEELAQKQVTSTVGGGMVSATVNGKHELIALKIEKEIDNTPHQTPTKPIIFLKNIH